MPSKEDERMRRRVQRIWCSLLFVLLAVALAPTLAGAQTPTNPPVLAPGTDMTLYEATENLRFIGKALLSGQGGKRKATSELFGVARLGSPLCPLVVNASDCNVNATGTSDVNLTTGQGNIVGTVTVVAQGDNPFDSPELVVKKGKFVGIIDFSPAVAPPPGSPKLPFGTVSALLVVDGGGVFPFTGTFRQPVGDPAVYYTPGIGFDCMFGPKACTFVQGSEFALGFPTVRFEINPFNPQSQ